MARARTVVEGVAGRRGRARLRLAAEVGGRINAAADVAVGLAIGVGFLTLVRWRFHPDASFMGRNGPGTRTSALVFLVLFVHSLPEGFAVGTAFASDRAGLSLFVILEEVSGLLPVSFAFAAGAMLALIVLEMLPRAFAPGGRAGPSAGIAAGAALMLALSFLLGV